MNIKTLLFLTVLFYGCVNHSQENASETDRNSSKTIYFGGDIITMGGDKPTYVEAVVQENGKIVFVGSKTEATNNYKEAAQYDLKGKTMLPSFIDPHSHFMSALRMVNQVNVASPPVGRATSIKGIMELLLAYKKEHNLTKDDWIVGWGYDQDLLEEKRHITKNDIDAFLPDNKVLIIHVSMHGAILNSKALAWAGIDKNSVTPEGGIIARFPNTTEPAGLVMEMAFIPIFSKMPQPTSEEMMDLMRPAQMMYASNGYTQAVEGFSHVSDMELLQKAASEDKLFLDIISLPGFTEMDKWIDNPAFEFGKYHNHLKFGGGKFTLDGSPQGNTILTLKCRIRVVSFSHYLR